MTPRERFRENKAAVKQHADMADDAFLDSTLEVALSEMLWRQNSAAPISDGIRQAERMQGAKEFLTIWRGLSGKQRAIPTAQDDGGLLPDGEPQTRK